jgi:hypothetical protein
MGRLSEIAPDYTAANVPTNTAPPVEDTLEVPQPLSPHLVHVAASYAVNRAVTDDAPRIVSTHDS